LPSLPRQTLEYEGVASISSVALRDLTEGKKRCEEEEEVWFLLEGNFTSEEHLATCSLLSKKADASETSPAQIWTRSRVSDHADDRYIRSLIFAQQKKAWNCWPRVSRQLDRSWPAFEKKVRRRRRIEHRSHLLATLVSHYHSFSYRPEHGPVDRSSQSARGCGSWSWGSSSGGGPDSRRH